MNWLVDLFLLFVLGMALACSGCVCMTRHNFELLKTEYELQGQMIATTSCIDKMRELLREKVDQAPGTKE